MVAAGVETTLFLIATGVYSNLPNIPKWTDFAAGPTYLYI